MKKEFITTVLCFGIILFGSLFASAATRTVDTSADNAALTACTAAVNDCSLRGAISGAASGDTINFDTGIFSTQQTITLSGGRLNVTRNLTILGPGANLLTLSGNNAVQVFETGNGVNFNISDVTIAFGFGDGGAIRNFLGGGTVTVTNCVITGNRGLHAGGIRNVQGTVIVINSTVSNNMATISGGGGILNESSLIVINSTISGNSVALSSNGTGAGIRTNGPTTIVSSTITNNTGAGSNNASGVFSSVGGVIVRNSIIAGNVNNATVPDVWGGFVSRGNNLVGNASSSSGFNQASDLKGTSSSLLNPNLAPLGNYGGVLETHAPLSNSQALNAGNDCVLTLDGCGDNNQDITTDQRGIPRKIGSAVDIGSFEQNITFNQSTLPRGYLNVFYSQTLTVTRQMSLAGFAYVNSRLPDSIAPFTFSIIPIAGQHLPPGLTLAPDGTISGTPSLTGIYAFTVKATDTDGMSGAAQHTIQITAVPTAAGVWVSGRVLTPDGRGLRNAAVILTDASGRVRATRTTTFGYYRFENVAAGETYVFEVRSKRYHFAPQVVTVTEDLSDLNFTAQ